MSKVYRMKLSEFKQMIKEEVMRARKLNEQGRPRMEETDSPAYQTDEFIQYVTAGRSKSKRGMGAIRSPRGVKSVGPGRPEEFQVSLPKGVAVMSGAEIADAYDPKGREAFEVWDMEGAYMAKVPLDLELIDFE